MNADEDRLFKHIGRCIQKARKDRGLTQDDLAAWIKLSRTSITNFEAGNQRLPLAQLYILCKALDINIHDALLPVDEIVLGDTIPAKPTVAERHRRKIDEKIQRLIEKRNQLSSE